MAQSSYRVREGWTLKVWNVSPPSLDYGRLPELACGAMQSSETTDPDWRSNHTELFTSADLRKLSTHTHTQPPVQVDHLSVADSGELAASTKVWRVQFTSYTSHGPHRKAPLQVGLCWRPWWRSESQSRGQADHRASVVILERRIYEMTKVRCLFIQSRQGQYTGPHIDAQRQEVSLHWQPLRKSPAIGKWTSVEWTRFRRWLHSRCSWLAAE